MLLLAVGVILLLYILQKVYWQWTYWEKKKAPHMKPFPILGKLKDIFVSGGNIVTMATDVYNSFPDQRYVGFFQFLQPMLFIRDPNLIKQIAIRDFENFSEHIPLAPEDRFFGGSLLTAKTRRWKDLRPALSPAFTASKMRSMFCLIEDVARQLVDYLKESGELTDIELKGLFGRFAMDTNATTSFGMHCDSLREKENIFYTKMKKLMDLSGLNVGRFMLNMLFPKLAKILGIEVLDSESVSFFEVIIKRTVEERLKKKVVRPDFIQFLLESRIPDVKVEEEKSAVEAGFAAVEESNWAKKPEKKKVFTDEDIVIQALSFFAAGFDMVSNAMSLTVYELATNPIPQKRLQEELDRLWPADGILTYDQIAKFKYLDMVVSETLRKWPPTVLTDRMAMKKYVIEPELPGETRLEVDEGTCMVLPMWMLHRDEKIYNDPDEFRPERFSDENKGKINDGTYFPFGIGPRNCIGSRFALMEIKVLVSHLLKNFEVYPTEKTQVPLKLKGYAMNFQVPGFWVGFRRRKL